MSAPNAINYCGLCGWSGADSTCPNCRKSRWLVPFTPTGSLAPPPDVRAEIDWIANVAADAVRDARLPIAKGVLDGFNEMRLLVETLATQAEARHREATTARPLEQWREEDGDALWWKFPVSEAPYVGSPLSDNFPSYVTHWTPLPEIPTEPERPQANP